MSRALTLIGYAAIAIAIVGYQLRARRRGTTTFAAALTLALHNRVGRAVLLGGWLWLGWHLFVRTGER